MRSNGRFRIMLSIVLSVALALGQTPATAGRALAAESADSAAQAPASTPDDAAGTTAPEAELPGGAALTQALSADANEAGESAASVDPVSEPTAATPDATATPGAIPASDPTSDAAAAPASDATTADPAPTPEPVSRPALDWVGSATNGAIVSIHAPEGALPEGTVPSVASATPEQARAALDASSALLEGEPVDALAVDVSFSRGGAEVEPAPGAPVQVTLRSIASVSGTRFSCVHVADDGSAEVVATATPTHAEFASDSFSVYAIVGEDAQVRARVAFVSATSAGAVTGATLSTQIVHAGDTLEAPAPPAAAAEKSVFSHWSVGTGADVVDVAPWLGRALSNDDIASLATAAGATFDPATNLYDLTATATFAPAHTVRFHQYGHDESVAEADLDATDAYSSLTDASGSIDLSGASLSFTPIVEGVDAHLVGWASFAPGAPAGAAPLASYDTDAVVTGVSSDLDLYPVLSTGFTVTLDTRSAATLESLFVAEDATGADTLAFDRLPTAESLGTNFNPGYTFAGWYRDGSYETKVEGDITGISENIKLYAKWDPATVTYTIVNMLEGPENKPGEGHYTFYSSEVAYGVVGTHVPLPTEGSTTYAISNADGTTRNESFMGYHIPDSEETAYGSEVVMGDTVSVNAHDANALISEETIDPSGTTTVKLYWNRNRLAIRFFTNSSKTTQLATDTYIKYGQKVKTFEHDNSLHNFLATYKSGKGRFINVLEVAPYVLDADGDMAFLHTGDSDVSISQLVDKFSRDSFPDNWSWVYQYVSFDYMKCMPGVDYSGKTVVSRTVQGATSNYYMMKSTIEVTQRAAGVHRGADNAAWVGGTAYDTRGYLVAANMRDGMHNLGTGARYVYAGRGLISNSSWPGGYGCELFYHPYTYVLSFANTVGSSVNPTDAEETSVNRDYGSLVSSDGAVSKYVVGETTREANGRDYVFDGWYVDASAAANHLQPDRGDYRIDPATWTMPDANTALYAGWTPKTYEVTFDSVGGQMVEQEGAVLSEDGSKLTLPKVEGGTTVAKPETPTKTVGGVDYTFTGWYKDPDYTEPWVFSSSTPHGPTTLYAKWVKGRTYHVTYHTSEGAEIEHVDDTLYRYGARARVAPEQPGESHDEPFLGWSTVRGNASYLVGQSVTVNSHTDLFAIYGSALPGAAAGDVEEGAPRVTLHSNYASLPEGDRPGAEVESTIQAERANAAVTLPSGIAGADATGYHVSGWRSSPDGSGDTYDTGEAVAVSSDTDLFAVWKANQLSATLSATFTYDGTEHRPEPTVSGWDGSTLVLGTDYELSWSDNVRAHAAEGEGAPTVTVTGLGDYRRSEPATATFAISPRKVTLTADNKSSRVNELVEPLTASVTAGSLVREGDLGTVSAHVSGEIDTSEAGAYVILISYAANPDYEVTVVPGTYRVSAASLLVTAQGWSGTYDGRPHSATVSLSPAVEGATVWYSTTTPLDDSNYSTSGSTDVPSRTRAGTTTVYYYVKGTESYKPDDDDRAGSLELAVARAPLVATALPRKITYGEGPANGGVSWVGFAPGESESNLDLSGLSFSYDSLGGDEGSEYVAGSPAGSYRISVSGASSDDYDISYAPGTLTVARRPLSLVWSAADSMPYTGSARTYAGATLAGLWGSDVVSCDLSGASETHAGEYVATVTGLTGTKSSSYSLPDEGLSHPWSVTQAANSATAQIDDWTYDGTSRAVPTAVAGFGAATATFVYADSADGPFTPDPPVSAGTHWVRALIEGTPDYAGAESPAKAFEVARRPVLIDGVSAADKVYDGTAAAAVTGTPAVVRVPGVPASGPVAGDDVSVAPGAASFDSASAGTGKAVTFSGWSLSGATGGNYLLQAQPAGATADILRRPARVVARSYAASYGDEPPAYAADWENLAPGEGPADAAEGTLSLSCAYARWSDAGEYPIVPSGVAATSNYELEPVAGALDVARAENRWVAGPSMASWTLGEPVPAPVAQAAFGEAALSFAPALAAQAEGDGWSPDVPTSPGSYVMRAEVEGTPNYDGLSAEVPFSVSAATLSYDANSPLATGSVPPAEGAVGESVEVAGAGGLAWPGHSFLGWNAAPDGSGDAYLPGDPFTLTGGPDVLYAQWLPTGELRYEGNGADSGETPPNLGNAGEVVRAAACGFSRVGCRFAGWNGSADGSGERVMPGDAVTLVAGGQRLYAQWEVNEISAALAGGPFALPADGSGARPRPTVLGWDGRVLSEGVDYELSWADNLAPTAGGPRATVTVTPLPGTEHALARPVTIEFDVVVAAAPETAPEAAPGGPAAVPADPTTPVTGDPSTLAAPALAAAGLAAVAASLRRRRRPSR